MGRNYFEINSGKELCDILLRNFGDAVTKTSENELKVPVSYTNSGKNYGKDVFYISDEIKLTRFCEKGDILCDRVLIMIPRRIIHKKDSIILEGELGNDKCSLVLPKPREGKIYSNVACYHLL